MWRKFSLQTRLNLLVALVLVLGLAANIGRLVLEAGPRIQAEDDSVIRLAREFVDASVADLNGSSDPETKLAQIVDGLQKLRHVSVTLARDGASEDRAPADDPAPGVDAPPEWFVAMVRPEPTRLRIPVAFGVSRASFSLRGSFLIASSRRNASPCVGCTS